MTTNKPKVLAYHVNKENPEYSGVTLEALILLSDYEALQAECEKLRKAMHDLKARVAEIEGALVCGQEHKK